MYQTRQSSRSPWDQGYPQQQGMGPPTGRRMDDYSMPPPDYMGPGGPGQQTHLLQDYLKSLEFTSVASAKPTDMASGHYPSMPPPHPSPSPYGPPPGYGPPPHMMSGPQGPPPHMMSGPQGPPPHMMSGPQGPPPPHMMSGPQGPPPHMMSGPQNPYPTHTGMAPYSGPQGPAGANRRRPITLSGKMGPPAAIKKNESTEKEDVTKANAGWNNLYTAPDLLKINFKEQENHEQESDDDDDAIDAQKAEKMKPVPNKKVRPASVAPWEDPELYLRQARGGFTPTHAGGGYAPYGGPQGGPPPPQQYMTQRSPYPDPYNTYTPYGTMQRSPYDPYMPQSSIYPEHQRRRLYEDYMGEPGWGQPGTVRSMYPGDRDPWGPPDAPYRAMMDDIRRMEVQQQDMLRSLAARRTGAATSAGYAAYSGPVGPGGPPAHGGSFSGPLRQPSMPYTRRYEDDFGRGGRMPRYPSYEDPEPYARGDNFGRTYRSGFNNMSGPIMPNNYRPDSRAVSDRFGHQGQQSPMPSPYAPTMEPIMSGPQSGYNGMSGPIFPRHTTNFTPPPHQYDPRQMMTQPFDAPNGPPPSDFSKPPAAAVSKPRAAPVTKANGGLNGFNTAQDLLQVKFDDKEEMSDGGGSPKAPLNRPKPQPQPQFSGPIDPAELEKGPSTAGVVRLSKAMRQVEYDNKQSKTKANAGWNNFYTAKDLLKVNFNANPEDREEAPEERPTYGVNAHMRPAVGGVRAGNKGGKVVNRGWVNSMRGAMPAGQTGAPILKAPANPSGPMRARQMSGPLPPNMSGPLTQMSGPLNHQASGPLTPQHQSQQFSPPPAYAQTVHGGMPVSPRQHAALYSNGTLPGLESRNTGQALVDSGAPVVHNEHLEDALKQLEDHQHQLLDEVAEQVAEEFLRVGTPTANGVGSEMGGYGAVGGGRRPGYAGVGGAGGNTDNIKALEEDLERELAKLDADGPSYSEHGEIRGDIM